MKAAVGERPAGRIAREGAQGDRASRGGGQGEHGDGASQGRNATEDEHGRQNVGKSGTGQRPGGSPTASELLPLRSPTMPPIARPSRFLLAVALPAFALVACTGERYTRCVARTKSSSRASKMLST